MSYEQVLLEIDEVGVATVTLNRPEALNAWNQVIAQGLSAALRQCADDDKIRVIVITGAGDRAFCAGVDMSGGNPFDRGDTRDREEQRTTYSATYPYQVPKPVIAAINGHAIGIGITYPLLADIRLVAENAKISFMFVRRGVVPELAAHSIVPRLCGPSVAAELLFSGKTIKGKEAADLGLANRALPQAEVLPQAQALAREIAINGSPAAVSASKRLLWEAETLSVPTLIEREGRVLYWLGSQPDAMEGITAYLQKRDPKWQSHAGDVPEEMFK